MERTLHLLSNLHGIHFLTDERWNPFLVDTPRIGGSMTYLLLCWLTFSSLVAAHASLPPASPSEYSSSGKVKQFVGHINDLKGLTGALEACSYRKEIIMISTTEHFVDAAAQTLDMLG